MLATLFVIFVSLLLYAVPGLLLYPFLKPLGYGHLISLGLAVALLNSLFALVASLVGYVMWLQLALLLLVDLGLLAALYRTGQLADLRDWLPTLPSWRWLLIAVIIVGYVGPGLVIPVPFDTDAQGFGLLISTVRLSGSITTLAPHLPEVGWFYSPGYFLLTALVADLTNADLNHVMLGFSHLTALGLIGAVYALGTQWWGEKVGLWAAVAMAIPNAMFTTLMDSAYTNIYGIWLTAAFLATLGPAIKTGQRAHMALAAVTLGSVLLAHPDSIIHLLLAYIPFYFTVWLSNPRPTRAEYLRLIVWIPALGILSALPWIIKMLPLVAQIDVHERQNPAMLHLSFGMYLNGFIIPVIAALGLWPALRRRDWPSVWLLTWLPPIIEISALGNFNRLSLMTPIDPMQVFYPLGVIWHATIIPLPLLAALFLAPAADWLTARLPKLNWPALTTATLTLTLALGLAATAFATPIVTALRPYIGIVGAVASPADVAAFHWIRENTPADILLLNYPGRYEGQWAPVITERHSVYLRDQLFYLGAADLRDRKLDLEIAYLDPLNHEATIRQYGIDYIVVPQSLRNPNANVWRWRPPDLQTHLSDWRNADYVELVFERDGAEVYRVLP